MSFLFTFYCKFWLISHNNWRNQVKLSSLMIRGSTHKEKLACKMAWDLNWDSIHLWKVQKCIVYTSHRITSQNYPDEQKYGVRGWFRAARAAARAGSTSHTVFLFYRVHLGYKCIALVARWSIGPLPCYFLTRDLFWGACLQHPQTVLQPCSWKSQASSPWAKQHRA